MRGRGPNGQMPEEVSPEVIAARKRAATSELANQLFMGLSMQPTNQTVNPTELVDRAFALAEAFDDKMDNYLNPAKPPLVLT